MKTKILIFLLIIICAGLVVGLISVKQDADKQYKNDLDTIELGSNQLNEANGKWEEEKQNALVLQKDLAARRDDISKRRDERVSAEWRDQNRASFFRQWAGVDCGNAGQSVGRQRPD